jgi:hypothetical protein
VAERAETEAEIARIISGLGIEIFTPATKTCRWRPRTEGARPSAVEMVSHPIVCFAHDKDGATLLCEVAEKQLQILRLTTPKLRYVWGPVRSE